MTIIQLLESNDSANVRKLVPIAGRTGEAAPEAGSPFPPSEGANSKFLRKGGGDAGWRGFPWSA